MFAQNVPGHAAGPAEVLDDFFQRTLAALAEPVSDAAAVLGHARSLRRYGVRATSFVETPCSGRAARQRATLATCRQRRPAPLRRNGDSRLAASMPRG